MTELSWEGKCDDGKKVAPVRIPVPFEIIGTRRETGRDRPEERGFINLVRNRNTGKNGFASF